MQDEDGLAFYEAMKNADNPDYFADLMAEVDEEDDKKYAELRKAEKEEEEAKLIR